jgi:hypothetical protein
MGDGRWDPKFWSSTRASYNASNPTVDHIFRSSRLAPDLAPADIKLRESRDSASNPNSTALIVALDVTGSMDKVLDVMARDSLGTLVASIYERRPITDPHIMIMGIGDFECDRSPVQATQFEAENKLLVEQMEKIHLERGGGGNHYESYAAAWLFAATKTSIDCFEKRGKRGYLFTVGDEQPTPILYAKHIKQFLGLDEVKDLTGPEILKLASATYDIFHVIVEEGSHARAHPDQVRREWVKTLGQHVLPLGDHEKLAEVIVSAIEVAEGRDKDAVAGSWSGATSVVVANAIRDIVAGEHREGAVRLNY